MEQETDNFNWVMALSECSVGVVFEKLRQQVKEDAEAIKGILDSQPRESRYYAISFSDTGASVFSVILEGNKIHRTVRFEYEDRTIRVADSDGPGLTATLTINSERKCRVKVKDQEYELWEFRKMALENMFFERPKPSTSRR